MSQLEVSSEGGKHTITTSSYQLSTRRESPHVLLYDSHGTLISELFVPSSVHTTAGQDDTTRFGSWSVERTDDAIWLSVAADSSIWQRKLYRFRCEPHRLAYYVTVSGEGQLTDAHYFGGYYSGTVRWGSGFFPSGQRFRSGFTPEPNTAEAFDFAPAGSAVIDLTGVPLPGRDDWFFTPPPFCFALEHNTGWLGLGVEARAGEHLFSEYRYQGRRGAFSLSLSYDGQTAVSGTTTLPVVGIDFASDPYAVLQAHCQRVREVTGAGQSAPRSVDWWREPIFCGWGAQNNLASAAVNYVRNAGARPTDYATQANYERFLNTLAEHDLNPGIVVIDDKWQRTYGENRVDLDKWPDLPGFIARQHQLGRRVLLWLKLWDPEGVSDDECIRNFSQLPIAVDPTSPRFERRLREAVRHMLGANGYGADGFKLDFSARIPSGPGLRRFGRAWGLELMKCYVGILADEARRTRPDALIMAHTPHPYLADVVDMIRLNDVNIDTEIVRAMTHRAKIAAIACPTALIDTDNWPVTNRESWRAYLRHQAKLGIPSLYYVDHIDATGEPLEPEDYRMLREVWASQRVAG